MTMVIDSLIGQSPEFEAVLNGAGVVAATDVSVLILGESGTGKERFAHLLHSLSRRSGLPFVSINCAALPENLIESELFGHRKGAFTGADVSYDGRIRAAAGGTVFLDEIGELPLPAQAKLLRFLESRECQAVGESVPRKVDVRVIAATNCDLFAAVRAGKFRQDLYYRLNVVPMELPPLRQRDGDIPILLSHFVERLSAQHGLPAPRFTAAAKNCLARYSWPGNVRELRNFCERMVVLLSGREIDVTNLPAEFRGVSVRDKVSVSVQLPDAGLRLNQVERDLILQALEKTVGNRSRAARLLGITRDTLLYRIKKYAIQATAAH